ncbi:MAG: nitroreductase family protein, partial [Firmicutes bacterium]|nr:nitroreductase family protein [Bacillota bacterium]
MSAEAILEAIRRRRSVRRYRPDPVERETVDRLLDAARWAPSAGNLQPWFFYVVTEARLKRELAAA